MTTTTFTDGVTLSAASWFNDVDSTVYSYLTAVAGTNTITATGPNNLAYAAGVRLRFIPANANTGATTLNVTGLGPKNIFLRGAALVGGELIKNQPVEVVYDGTQFNIVGNSAWGWVQRSYLAGLTLSTAGASTTMTTAAGMAADSTNQVLMATTASIAKTTSAWAVGTGNGGLDTGAIANSTWYHFWQIMRPDTGVVDVLLSLSVSAPTMPTSYTYKRRIGSGLTNGSGQWTLFVQQGDLFQWSTVPTLDVNATSSGTGAVSRTLTVPTGVNVIANIIAGVVSTSGLGEDVYISDLATTDSAPSLTASPLIHAINPVANGLAPVPVSVRTNTSAQIRTRQFAGGATETLRIATLGWIDRRGRDD